MGNCKNLTPFSARSVSEARENGRKGGIASGVSRSFRSAVKKRVREHPELIEDIVETLITMAIDEHDLKAVELLVELAGESPRQMEIKIKQQEL